MRQEDLRIGQYQEVGKHEVGGSGVRNNDFVLEKSIFANIFEKDIRRVYIYKKAERLAKAIHLVTPAFAEAVSLRDRVDAIAIGLIDAAIRPPAVARTALSRELLALSSILSIARTGGLLSAMNAELIAREAQTLLQEVASYEEPRLFLDDAPTLSGIARSAPRESAPANGRHQTPTAARHALSARAREAGRSEKKKEKRTVSVALGGGEKRESLEHVKDRREGVLSVIKDKERASIKDISMLFRGVSEKTIQRELLALVQEGLVIKQGERRWSTYSLR